jgi:uncharacterized protein YoaH (UPF0181 family)
MQVTEESMKQTMEAITKIQELYDAGTPLYTKEAIQDVQSQLRDKNRQQISVTGLDGNKVEFEIFGDDFKLNGYDGDANSEWVPYATMLLFEAKGG